MDPDFSPPDFTEPLDLAERLTQVPRGHSIKGMFLQSLVDQAKAAAGRTPGRGRYLPFKDYTFTEWMELMVECAACAHPRVTAREGMRRLGQKAYPTFTESTLGKVVMSVAGIDLVSAFRLTPRIYGMSGKSGTVEITNLAEGRAVVHLRGMWDFPTAWHVGVFEGGIRAFGKTPLVKVRSFSKCDADIEARWW
jgi:uncharacterized protein (TIGR02265 family)